MANNKKKQQRVRAATVSEWIAALLVGLTKLPSGVTSIMVDGMVYQVPDLVTKLTTLKALFDAADAALRAYKKALASLGGTYDDTVTFVQNTRATVKPMIGRKSADLVDYGLKPDKTPAALTVEQTTTKVAKNKATRKARGTMGPKQKAAIHGTVPAEPPAPPTSTPIVPLPPVKIGG